MLDLMDLGQADVGVGLGHDVLELGIEHCDEQIHEEDERHEQVEPDEKGRDDRGAPHACDVVGRVVQTVWE